MGRNEYKIKINFSLHHVKNKDLVIEMLKFEEKYNNSKEGQLIYKTKMNNTSATFFSNETISRKVLSHFGFNTSNESLEAYYNIFRTYYKSPFDYDKDVINSSFYMRNNKCIFYTMPELVVGDKMKNCNLLALSGDPMTLFDILPKDFNYCFVGGFSMSWPPFLARKELLFSLAESMIKHKIYFILIQIDEAHSTAWNIGVEELVEPHKTIDDRLRRANQFAKTCPYEVYVDVWSNEFAETYTAWPDKYYCFDNTMTIIQHSIHHESGDREAEEQIDCTEFIMQLCNE